MVVLFIYIYLFFSIPFVVFALLFSLPPSRNSELGSHSRLFSFPTTVRALHFLSDETSAVLPLPTRVDF